KQFYDFFANHTGLSIVVGVVTAPSRKNVTITNSGGIHFITVTEAETCRQLYAPDFVRSDFILLNLWTQREDELGESYHPTCSTLLLASQPESLAAMKIPACIDIINLRFSLLALCFYGVTWVKCVKTSTLRETIKSTIEPKLIALFLAGGDTSANTYMARRKMMAEIDSVLAMLNITSMCHKETLRLYPAFHLFLVGTRFQRNVVWTDIMIFIMIEILERSLAFIRRDGLIYSSSRNVSCIWKGPHMCIGQKLAMIELKTVLQEL
ncbi:hypothetical protein BC829DRAFT_381232, partial [Chytridium lagenaria]